MRHASPLRVLGLIIVCWALGPAAPALAQDPLTDCKTKRRFSATGPQRFDKEGFMRIGVVIECDETMLFADEISWDEKTLRASGALLIVQDGLRVTAERMEMDRQTRLGTFYKAAGTARLTDRQIEKSMFGTLEPEVSFAAEKLEKLGPRKYRLTDGWFSTCLQANPRWDVRGSSGTVTLDERVILRNAVLRVKGIPVIYLPVLYYPIGEDDRSTGFLLPTYSTSVIRGQGISNAFFWAINRSQDLTLFHDWFSKSGQGTGAEYQFVSSPSSRGSLYLYMLDERARSAADGSVERPATRSQTARATLNQSVGRYFRALARVDYFTDVTTLQLYQQDVYEASKQTRYFTGSISGGINRFRLSAEANRRDFYTSANTAIRVGRLPQITASVSEQPFRRTGIGRKIIFGMNTEVAGIQNQTDISQSSTNTSLWRFDARPTLRAPLSSLTFLDVMASMSWRLTRWSESLDPLTGTTKPEPITRPLAEVSLDVTGPRVQRVFRTPSLAYAEGFKHMIEPRVSVQWLSKFDRFADVVRNDSAIDCIVGGNTTVSYSLNNRVLAKRKAGGGRTQDILSVGVSQSYYTQPAAAACDTQYQTATATTVGQFSPIQFSAAAAPTDAVSGRFQMFMDYRTKAIQSYSASVSTFGQRGQLSAAWSKRQFLPNVPGFDNPLFATHSLHGTASLRASDGRVGGTYGFRVDLKARSFLEQRWLVFYNAQCCGISVDYQIYNLAFLTTGPRQDHRFNFSFTLAGIGSFSNPLGSFGR